jgi:hypothetical protein
MVIWTKTIKLMVEVFGFIYIPILVITYNGNI